MYFLNLTVSTVDEAEIKIYDLEGKTVFHALLPNQDLKKTLSIDTDKWSNEIYLLEFVTIESAQRIKLVEN